MAQTSILTTDDDKRPTDLDRLYPRVAGSLIGAAAGDSLGWITEFVRGIDHLRKLYRTDFVTEYRPWQKTTGGRFNAYIDYISKGQYSDDTQLALATARSLNADGTVNPTHFASTELPLWLDYARGAGRTITAAARSMRRKSARWNDNFFTIASRDGSADYRDAGANGAAMRVGPIALANPFTPAVMQTSVWQNAITTHGHPRAIFGALLYAEAVRLSLVEKHFAPQSVIERLLDYSRHASPSSDPELQEWLAEWDRPPGRSFEGEWETTRQEIVAGLDRISKPESENDWKALLRYFGCFDPATKGSGVGTVLAALAIFYQLGERPSHAIATAVNQIGTDTDTIAGFVGGLAGATHGYDSIPMKWARELQDYDYFMRVANEIAAIAIGHGLGGKALLPGPQEKYRDVPDLLRLLREHAINRDEVVYHPLFGRGVVESVDAQALRRKDGAKAVFAWVNFYIGQSCKFRFIEIPRRTSTSSGSESLGLEDNES